MTLGRDRCPDCDGGFLEGNGKCAQCHGTGINTQLDSAQPKCPYCAGAGTCATCFASGDQGDDSNDIQTLFH
jgi:DnaJ-class molecular chaperone